MKKKAILKSIISVLSVGALVLSFAFSVKVKQEEKAKPIITQSDTDVYINTKINSVVKTDEMRAVWVPFMSLDMSGTDRSFDAFKDKFNAIADNAVSCGLNTLIVQVRPFCDALYKSEIFPDSHILSGTQGKKVDYDALEYMTECAHDKGLKIHAWINPLRVKSEGSSFELSNENPARKWSGSDYAINYNSGIYLNPAYSEVRKLIIDGVREIVNNYEVDGIQFDDYFYPTTESSFDEIAYNEYLEGLSENETSLTLSQWRTSNINMLISGVYSAVHSIRDDVVFGIAPQGNIDNDISMCADVESWASINGYVDYLCPQLYVSFEHSILPFEDLANQWAELVKNSDTKLYFGLALYKAGSDDDDGTWQGSNDIIKRQIELSRSLKTDGFMLYSYDYLFNTQTEQELVNAMAILS